MAGAQFQALLGQKLFPTTAYANAGGTGDRSATITVTNTGFQSIGGGTLSNLVDGAIAGNSSDAVFFTAASGVTNGGFVFDFGSVKYIDAFKWYQATSSSAGTYVFEGSNDNSSYTQLGSSFTLNDPSAGSGTEFLTPHTTPAFYRYYRVRQTAGSSAGQPWLEEIEFKIG